MPTFAFANRITHESWDHPELLKAREQGDLEKVDAVFHKLLLPNGQIDTKDYVRVDAFTADNINTTEGKIAALEAIVGVTAASTTWYIAPFESDVTPDKDWNVAWADLPTVTEFDDFTESGSGRRPITFDANATNPGSGSRCEITNSTRTTLTVGAGVTNRNIYGVCITDVVTLNYNNPATGVLLAAVRYPQVKVYNTGEVKYLGYQIYIP